MKMFSAVCIVFAVAVVQVSAANDGPNPLSQTIELLDSLAAKVTEDGVAEMKAYKEYSDFCTNKIRSLGFSITEETTEKEELTATIAKKAADIQASTSKIEELAGTIASDESELKDATTVREKESADFKASDAELVDTIDMLGRAIIILSREMAKNPASFAQMNSMKVDDLV